MDFAIPWPLRVLFKYIPQTLWRCRADIMDLREATFSFIKNTECRFSHFLRNISTDMMKKQLPDRPDMWEKLTPNYPPGCKRVLPSDDYFRTLARDNVSLQTKRIEKITEKGIRLKGGDEEEFDLIVLATGFRSLDFMHPIKVIGGDGRSLSDIWKDGARALYGVTVESMPNFGMLYGPNTNLGHNSIILMIEAQARYISVLVDAVLQARSKGKSLTIIPRPERVEEFNVELQAALKSTAFAHPSCNSWYKTDEGLITNNWSGTVVDYQKLLSKICWNDFDLSGKGAEGLASSKIIGRVVEETYLSYKTLGLTAVSVLAIAGGLAMKAQRRVPGLR